MKVLLVNTYENKGGAAVATKRLMHALNNNGIKAKMLVAEKETDCIEVVGMGRHWQSMMNFLLERIDIWLHLGLRKQHLWELDSAKWGMDITRLPEFKEADVIHLSWINHGMLSLKGIRKILESGKPVVWTMHDLWPAMGLCHYARGCNAYKTECHNCPLLPRGGSRCDLSTSRFRRKLKLYHGSGIHFVACSKWLAGEARLSALFGDVSLEAIPNPIDTHIFHPADKRKARKKVGLPDGKRVVLFVSQSVTDERKGMAYFVKAMEKLIDGHPEVKASTVVAILGGHSEELVARMPLEAFSLGYVSDQKKITDVYNSADVFVLPSLEDNLPNTIMEAMACGVPCVGFNVGGIPEMIDHKANGYVASYKDDDDLSVGINWVLSEADPQALQAECMRKVRLCYSQQAVAHRYGEVYNRAVDSKRK